MNNRSFTRDCLSIGFIALAFAGSALADSATGNQAQPCDPGWSACAIGRADPFDIPSSGDVKGKFLIDIFYGTPAEIRNNQPLLGDGPLGSPQQESPELSAYVAPGATDVMLQIGSQPGAAQKFAIGRISAPIGTDVGTYYTRQVLLNPGVRITEGPTQTTESKYCDAGGVFGAVIYNEEFNNTTYVITGVTPEPLNYQVQRMRIKSSYPAIFGCGN